MILANGGHWFYTLKIAYRVYFVCFHFLCDSLVINVVVQIFHCAVVSWLSKRLFALIAVFVIDCGGIIAIISACWTIMRLSYYEKTALQRRTSISGMDVLHIYSTSKTDMPAKRLCIYMYIHIANRNG